MQTLYFDPSDSLDTILSRIQAAQDSHLKLEIPEDSIIYQNPLNLKIIKELAAEAGKSLEFRDLSLEQRVEEKETPEKEPPPKKPPKKRLSKPKILAAISALVIVFATALLAFVYFYLPSSTVTLFVEEKSLEKEEKISVLPGITEVDSENLKIPGKVIKVEEEESGKFSATGKATVGERATGKVTIQNWTDQKTVIAAGTQIKVEGGQEGAGLTFTLDSDVAVAAQTFSIPAPGQKLYEAGMADAAVTATEIGETYNLPAGLSFSVGNYDFSDFSASNSSGFSGGSTREVTVVSQEDQNKAKDELSAKLFAKGKEDLQSKLLGDQKLLEGAVKEAVLSAQFSCKTGEEASNFEATLKTQSSATVYSESHLKTLLSEVLESSIPEGFKISSEQQALSAEVIKVEEEGKLQVMGKIKVLLIPDFGTEELSKKLLGKRPWEAHEILKNTPRLAGFEIKLWPPLPKALQTLPYRKERLNFQIEVR